MLQGASTARNLAIGIGLSEKNHFVVSEFESESARYCFLEALNLLILEFDDSIALDADHVVVVLSWLFRLIPGLIVSETTRRCEITFSQ